MLGHQGGGQRLVAAADGDFKQGAGHGVALRRTVASSRQGSRVTVRIAGQRVVRGFPYESSGSSVSSRPCCIPDSVAVERVEAPVLV